MPTPVPEPVIVGALNPVEGKVVSVPSHQEVNDKIRANVNDNVDGKDNVLATESKESHALSDSDDGRSDDVIIITGADAAAHLLPLRDDGEPALTFRSLVLATALSAFQAVMTQIYSVSQRACVLLDSKICIG